MQKQFSNNDCIEDKYSIYSKSGRKLYRRINNNIRVLNKSKVSSRSNNSIGSVALRRTQLSNDKIYSRQEEFIPLNSSQVGFDFQSIYEKGSSKKSIPMTPIQSNDNYRQRLKQSMSHRSSRADSQRSDTNKYNKYKRVNKQDIQKLYLLQSDNKPHVQTYRRQRSSSKRSSQKDPRSPKESIRVSRNIQQKKYDYNQIKTIRSIKSSLKSQLKSPSSKNLKQRKNYPQTYNQNNNYQIKKLSQKYLQPQSHLKLNDQRSSRRKKQENCDSRSRKKYQENHRQNIDKQKLLQKYQSQKVLPHYDDQPYSKYLKNGKKKDKYYEQNSINRQYERYYLQKNRKQNQLRDLVQKRYKNSQFSSKNDESNSYQRTVKKQNRKYKPQQRNQRNPNNDYYEKREKNYREQHGSSKNSINYYRNQRSSILDLRSKHNRNKMRNIRIKQQQYGNLYENNHQQNTQARRKQNKMDKYHDKNYKKSYKNSNYPEGHQYFDHLNNKYYNDHHHQNQRRTQISQTFDSLMLSLNSRVTASNSLNSIQNIVQKVKLHLNTLNLISDYTQQFKKMYEQIDLWEQLIFLTFKKFWVQRIKVYNFIKKFRKIKRHQSQRMGSSNSKRNILGHKISTMKNIGSQNYNKQSQNAFDDMDLQQNPFIIPFCKISQEQIKQLAKTQEGLVLLQQIQKQNQNSYKSLQQMYNFIIQKSGNHINMLFCDNFSQDIYILMLQQIQQLIPNLQQFSVFEVTKIRLGKIVKAGILILFLNGKYIRNISQILTYDDLQKIGNKKKIKMYSTYDLYYQVFETMVAQ